MVGGGWSILTEMKLCEKKYSELERRRELWYQPEGGTDGPRRGWPPSRWANTHRFPIIPCSAGSKSAATSFLPSSLVLSHQHKSFPLFLIRHIFKNPNSKKKRKPVIYRRKTESPTIQSSPRTVWYKWAFSTIPFSKKQWRKIDFLFPKCAMSFQCTTAKTTDTKRCQMSLQHHKDTFILISKTAV